MNILISLIGIAKSFHRLHVENIITCLKWLDKAGGLSSLFDHMMQRTGTSEWLCWQSYDYNPDIFSKLTFLLSRQKEDDSIV